VAIVRFSLRRNRLMISICCTFPKPDYNDLVANERKIFCKMVYLLRKRGYSVMDAQKVAYRKVLEDGVPFDLYENSDCK
jgi:hypothetical protein